MPVPWLLLGLFVLPPGMLQRLCEQAGGSGGLRQPESLVTGLQLASHRRKAVGVWACGDELSACQGPQPEAHAIRNTSPCQRLPQRRGGFPTFPRQMVHQPHHQLAPHALKEKPLWENSERNVTSSLPEERLWYDL